MRDRAQAVEAQVLRERLGEADVVELTDRPRRQAVAARLLAGELLLLDDEHAMAGLREPEPGRGARGTATDDERVPRRRRADASIVVTTLVRL